MKIVKTCCFWYNEFMKRIFKSKIFWVIIVLLVIGGLALVQFLVSRQQIEYITEEVKIGDVKQTVSATGQLKSAIDIELNFKTTGRLNSLNVFVGSKIIKGQQLATLRAVDLQIDINIAKANLLEAQANLQKILAGATREEVALKEAEVAKSESALTSAKSDLINNEIIYTQALNNAEDNLLRDINSSLSKASFSLQEMDDTINFEGNANNFNTFNGSLENSFLLSYDIAKEKFSIADESYSLTIVSPTKQNIEITADRTLSALMQVSDTLDDLSSLLDFVLTNANLTITKLDTLKTTINTERTTTNTSIDTVVTENQDLIDAQIDYDTKIVDTQNDINEAEKALVKAQADLNLIKAPARSEDILLAQAKVSKAEADLAQAQEGLSDTIIIAPQDGIITNINYEIGEQTSLTTAIIEMSASKNFKIEVDIPESDIAKVEVGDFINVTLDAFTEDDIFKAEVVSIDPAETEIQDVIYFNVTALLNDSQDESIAELIPKIKPGMTANIEISTAEVNNVLIIPFRAVKEIEGRKIVEVLENEKPREVTISTGLRGDEGEVEVTSGLNVGQNVITSVREK
ncbi:MAG: hypothetical protein CMI53_04645 [Parcubacteria group bacterium]|nr:hypothetical protein [Parcubacteria group bacterium]|tara:strand:+ start:5359 stop:7086 length:1728 start_codon:yes stop_codon:yes gene_type:complete